MSLLEWVFATHFQQQAFCLAAENADIRRRLCPVRAKLKRMCATCDHRIDLTRTTRQRNPAFCPNFYPKVDDTRRSDLI